MRRKATTMSDDLDRRPNNDGLDETADEIRERFTLPAPNPDRCVAFQGDYTGTWYILGRCDRYLYMGEGEHLALEMGARLARWKGWIK
jgi:hypothetical protein